MTFAIPETWTFDRSDVAGSFDSHVREQLPWYDLVTSALVQIARHYVPQRGLVYDIGASNGNVGRALADLLVERDARLVAIEPAREMARKYDGPGVVLETAAEHHDYEPFDFAVAMLALMFVPPSAVEPLLHRLRASIRPGGALVLVERTLPAAGYPSLVMSRLTLAAKAAMGASGAAIVAKELSLAGVQRPLDPALLHHFDAVEWFRFGDFAGYLIEAAA
jgi:tRNA (cmo5U34)-methyltransferase